MAPTIVLGYDGSDGSKAALVTAVAVARAFAARLTIVFGYEPNPMGGESSDYRNQLEELGKGVVGEAVAAALALDDTIEVEELIVPMRPAESLLETAVQREALAIVVGGSGERPILGAILGSVPHKLLHRSTVPVLVVPTPE
jgi:nucleotide-binding universal stress UspA family protein